MDSKAKLVVGEEQAIREIRSFQNEGYALEEIYVLAHDERLSERLSELMQTNTVGLREEGLADSVANLFRSKGDQLRSKMHALGLSKEETDYFENELDKGKFLVTVWLDDSDYELSGPDRTVSRRDDYVLIPPAGIYLTDRPGPGKSMW